MASKSRIIKPTARETLRYGRRGFLRKAGLGLAGILACQQAPFAQSMFFGWTPASLGSGSTFKHWYSAAYQAVSTLSAADRSGSANNANLSNNVSIVSSVTPKGKPVFRFNGTSSKITYSSITTGTTFSAFACLKFANGTDGAGCILWINGNAANQLVVSNGAENIACFDNTVHPTSSTIDMHTAWTVVGVVCNAGSCSFYQNGSLINTPAGSLTSLTVPNFGGSNSFFSKFDCTELLLLTRALNAYEISKTSDYMLAST